MKAYLAGQSQRCTAILHVANYMQSLYGYEFTEPWWLTAEAAQLPNPPDGLPRCADVAKADIAGVEAAEVVFAIIDLDVGPGRGLWFELGYAVAKQKPVHVLLVGTHLTDDIIQELVFLTATTSWSRQALRPNSAADRAAALHSMRIHETKSRRKNDLQRMWNL